MKKLLFFLLASMLARGVYVVHKSGYLANRNIPIIRATPTITPPAVKSFPGKRVDV